MISLVPEYVHTSNFYRILECRYFSVSMERWIILSVRQWWEHFNHEYPKCMQLNCIMPLDIIAMNCSTLNNIKLNNIKLNNIKLNCITLNCITPNCITLNCITPNCITLNCITPNCITPNCITLNSIPKIGNALKVFGKYTGSFLRTPMRGK